MTWRKFATLIKGFSKNSATVTQIQSDNYVGSGPHRGEKVNVVSGAKNADRAFKALFGPVERKRAPKKK